MSVAEIACVGAETVVMVMRSGRPIEAAKFLKPVATVGEEDLKRALATLKGAVKAGSST